MMGFLSKRGALKHAGAVAALLWAGAVSAQQVGTMVRVQTDKGPIDLQLYDQAAPATVANFLNYVRRGAFDGTFFHRLVTNFVLQGGGYTFSDTNLPRVSHIPTDAPIVLEAHASRSNLRGTVAMARTEDSNSATSEWYINLVDNTFLDPSSKSAGYAVFGRVSGASMAVVDALHRSPVQNYALNACVSTLGSSAGAMNVTPKTTAAAVDCTALRSSHLVRKHSVRVLPAPATLSDTDRVLNYLEALVPQYIAPASAETLNAAGYVLRYYANTQSYVGSKDGMVYYLVPAISPDIKPLAPLAELLQQAAAAGY